MRFLRLLAGSALLFAAYGCSVGDEVDSSDDRVEAKAAPLARFSPHLSALKKAIETPRTAEEAATGLLATGRPEAFNLQALFRLYEDEDDTFKAFKDSFKSLEDGIGEYAKYDDIYNAAVSQGKDPATLDRLKTARDEALAKFTKMLTDDHWRTTGATTRIAEVDKFLQAYPWKERNEDRRIIFEHMSDELKDIKKTTYDMKVLENGDGVHELRRDIRWVLIEQLNLNGMILADAAKACPIPAYQNIAQTPAGQSRYAQLSPSRYETYACKIPACVIIAAAKAVEDIGAIKDEAETLVNIAGEADKDVVPAPLQAKAQAVYDELVKNNLFGVYKDQIDACQDALGPKPGEAPEQVGPEAFDVTPYATFGSGNAGAGAEDIDEPDGLIFDAAGHLLMTDAMNHRVQVWDPIGKKKLGDFGSTAVFRGEIVDLAMNPLTHDVVVTDETSHVAYMFNPPTGKEAGALAATGYKYTGKELWTDLAVDKIGGVTYDSKGRLYSVDAHKNFVRRFTPDGQVDPTWKFEGSVKYLNGCEGIAVDEKRGNVYVSDEFESAIQVFDLENGSYKGHMIGSAQTPGSPGRPARGTSVFPAAPEGLWILDDYLLASDEADGGRGRVKIFDLQESTAFDTGASDYAKIRESGKRSGYIGAFGDFLSPDSVAAFTDKTGESYVALADQGHRKVVVYKWSDVVKAGKFAR